MPQSVESTVLIDFSEATVIAGFVTDTYILTVEGKKPYVNMQVSLIPRIYVVQPEYWEIEVVGSLPGIGLPALKAYSVFIPLEGIRGKKGIKVIGSNQELSIDVPAL
jgi:hypothetical protein